MRPPRQQPGAMFSFLSWNGLMPADHPLRASRPRVNVALERLSPQFSKLYLPDGCAKIALETLLRAWLLQAFYGCDPSAI